MTISVWPPSQALCNTVLPLAVNSEGLYLCCTAVSSLNLSSSPLRAIDEDATRNPQYGETTDWVVYTVVVAVMTDHDSWVVQMVLKM